MTKLIVAFYGFANTPKIEEGAAGYRFPAVFAQHVTGTVSNPYAVAVNLAPQQPTQSNISSAYVTAARAGRAGLLRVVKWLSVGSVTCNYHHQ